MWTPPNIYLSAAASLSHSPCTPAGLPYLQAFIINIEVLFLHIFPLPPNLLKLLIRTTVCRF